MLAILSSVVTSVAQPLRYEAEEPEQVVWQYLDEEFAKAAESPDFWRKVWFHREVDRSDVRLGKPFKAYNMPPENLEAFLSSGDLLAASILVYVSYPVFDRTELIGTVQVAESGGRWGLVSHMRGSPTDKMAVALGENAESVSIVGGSRLPAFILVVAPHSADMRAYPLGQPDSEFVEKADQTCYQWWVRTSPA